MDNKICGAYDCSNVIRGRRASSAYCSDSCRQRQKRFRKDNGIIGSPVSIGAQSVAPTGSLISDVSANASISLLRGSGDPLSNMMSGAVGTCIPYAIEAIKKYPLLSLALALGGYKAAEHVFSSCTDTTTVKDGKKEVATTCKKANALQKTGGAVVGVLGGAYIIENAVSFLPVLEAAMTPGRSRVRPRYKPRYKRNSVVFEPPSAS